QLQCAVLCGQSGEHAYVEFRQGGLGGGVRVFFFSSRRRHTRWPRDWSSDVCSSDLPALGRSSLERSIRALLTEEGASSRWKRKPPRRARLARSRAPISAYWRAISPSVRDISHCPR